MRLVLLVVLWTGMLGVQTAFAQSYGWNGPPCRFEAASFTMCSQEPAIPLDPMPCYVSKLADYVPDLVERRLVALCQAAKAALGAAPGRQTAAMSEVAIRGNDLALAVRNDPQSAAAHSETIRAVGEDLEKLGVRVAARGASGDRLADVRAAMEELAASMPREELNRIAFRLYEVLRPSVPEGVTGWGAKAELRLERVQQAGRYL